MCQGNITRKDGIGIKADSAGFTLDTYTHVTTAVQKEAAQTIGNVLSM